MHYKCNLWHYYTSKYQHTRASTSCCTTDDVVISKIAVCSSLNSSTPASMSTHRAFTTFDAAAFTYTQEHTATWWEFYYIQLIHSCICNTLKTTTTTTTPIISSLFSRTTQISQYQKGKTSTDLNEAKDRVWGCNGISWSICKQSAPRSRQITTPTSHHSIFTGWMLFLMPNQLCQSTEGKLY